jgi:glycosyltransferase involved in cell wall biosynthesis
MGKYDNLYNVCSDRSEMKPLSFKYNAQSLHSSERNLTKSSLALGKQGNHERGIKQPKICLGMPLYNQTKFLTEALESLLTQTYRDFRLVIVDDSTELGPNEIVKQFAARDDRICYIKNESRKGLVDNWRACFRHAGEVDYFAWVSDHDVWHPEWLEKMVRVLNSKPNVILVYPVFVRIAATGERIDKQPRRFSTDGLNEAQRIKAVCRDARGFGKMVYGLFRACALSRAGIFRRVLAPDVVLLFELCLQGDFEQVEEELWFRRRISKFSIARQKRSLFVRKPWYIYLPWPLVNACVLAWNTAIHPGALDRRHSYLGLKVTLMYLYRYIGKLGKGSWFG